MPTISQYPFEYLVNEANSLLTRLDQVKPFSLTMPMVKGASISEKALREIIDLLEKSKSVLRNKIYKFIDNVHNQQRLYSDPKKLQAGFSILKLRFNSILDQLDIFADVLSQRAEHDVGIWLAGLDVLAEDGLAAIRQHSQVPSLMVYLDRGHGAAIRRARTRLPGGDENPVAVIQIPRERMVGSGIASSLIHEVGHQVAALLDLVASLKNVLIKNQLEKKSSAWKYFERWISEIICDVWATGHLGIAATLGLMGVVTLPRYFQFRMDLDDPHPAPYVRVQLSCAFGKKIFPGDQWDRSWQMWKNFYPIQGLKNEIINDLNEIESAIPAFVDLVLNHSTKEMQGRRLVDFFPVMERQPQKLKQLYQLWKAKRISPDTMPPTMVFAILGQAKADLVIDASEETNILMKQLNHWAFTRN